MVKIIAPAIMNPRAWGVCGVLGIVGWQSLFWGCWPFILSPAGLWAPCRLDTLYVAHPVLPWGGCAFRSWVGCFVTSSLRKSQLPFIASGFGLLNQWSQFDYTLGSLGELEKLKGALPRGTWISVVGGVEGHWLSSDLHRRSSQCWGLSVWAFSWDRVCGLLKFTTFATHWF